MKLVILQVPDCPNAAVLETRLAPLLAARSDIVLTRQLVTGQADAERLGMTGSPTLLADGVDPFALPASPPLLLPPLPRRARPPRPRPLPSQLRASCG